MPLDPSYPADRLAYMLHDCAPMAVLTQTSLKQTFADQGVPVLSLDDMLPGQACRTPIRW
ncbi:hypothetical protein LP420_13370 [Massilia sp. B-10]|nr:hypothetical protein LP420_13370 [Massilia sp. B-10]